MDLGVSYDKEGNVETRGYIFMVTDSLSPIS